jgi:hypothetical protein
MSSIFNSKVWFFLFKQQQLKFFSIIFFWPKNFSFPTHFHFSDLFDLHNSIQSKQSFNLTGLTDYFPPQVNSDTPDSDRPSVRESRAAPRAPFLFQNEHCPSLSSPKNECVEEFHSRSVISPLWYRLPSILRSIKGVGSLTIHRHIHSLPYFEFLLHKNSLSPELKSPSPPLLATRPHPSLYCPELRSMRFLESTPSSPSIHDESPCIIATAHSNLEEFLLSQVHCESSISHLL